MWRRCMRVMDKEGTCTSSHLPNTAPLPAGTLHTCLFSPAFRGEQQATTTASRQQTQWGRRRTLTAPPRTIGCTHAYHHNYIMPGHGAEAQAGRQASSLLHTSCPPLPPYLSSPSSPLLPCLQGTFSKHAGQARTGTGGAHATCLCHAPAPAGGGGADKLRTRQPACTQPCPPRKKKKEKKTYLSCISPSSPPPTAPVSEGGRADGVVGRQEGGVSL